MRALLCTGVAIVITFVAAAPTLADPTVTAGGPVTYMGGSGQAGAVTPDPGAVVVVKRGRAFATTAGGSQLTSVTIPAGDSTASFYYGDTRSGTATITAASGGLADATQAETIEQAPAITSADHVGFTTTGAGSFTVTTSGAPTPSLSEAGTLPAGVTFTDDGVTAPRRSQVPREPVQAAFTV
jgi:hypothetical protein